MTAASHKPWRRVDGGRVPGDVAPLAHGFRHLMQPPDSHRSLHRSAHDEVTMIRLFDVETDAPLGTITEAQLEFLIDELEEESSTDRDYFINTATVEMLEEDGADAALLTVLRDALADRDEMEVRWASE
jgi:processive 1,2-diacylglycerol beta-glucosyltransferase